MKNKFTLNKFSLICVILLSILVGFFANSVFGINLSQIKINIKGIGPTPTPTSQNPDLSILQEKVLPKNGYTFKINWGSLGKQMVEDGVIDKTKLAQALTGGNDLPANYLKYFDIDNQTSIVLDENSSRFWVDVLWGLGLANSNPLLEKGPMIEGGNTANFASTGGYTIGAKKPMEIYNKSSYIKLTKTQQIMVEEIAQGVYRPCCGNSTAFPDCNHGMAALALVELMASQNFSKDEIFKTVLAFNSYWFPQTYLDIAYHFAKNNRDYSQVPASEILSKTFSSSSGYQVIRSKVGSVSWPALQGGGGCGV